MKKLISLFVLGILLVLSFNVVGAKSSTSQQENTVQKSAAWGFQCTAIDLSKITFLEQLNTYDTAEKASKLLGQHGYTTDLQKNPNNLSVVRSSFKDAEVFFFIGHGAPTAIGLTDDTCKPVIVFTKDYLINLGTQKLKFVLLSACETGMNITGPDNILSAFKGTGAKKVIGFNRFINQTSMNIWSEKFWKYALDDKMEVSDAAYKAADDVERMFWNGITPYWLTTNSLVILGTEPVYLGHEPEVPDLGQGWQQLLQSLWGYVQDQFQQIADQMVENIKGWWAEHWPNIQRSIENWIRRELASLLQQLLNSMETFVRENCLQPFGLALVFGGIFFYRKRRYP